MNIKSVWLDRSTQNNQIMFRVRAVMLDTGLQPYTDVADLFIIDPDGYIIR